ncbi:helix-turn-helix domain-containing protein [Pluralibacter gergoviae]|uniref:helix-turn-helix domain-containing protein n=1 Tax=Pluralibacter gergoviae TaxID=61647 RepID=UPI000BFB8ECF|nr:helix-turn-helix domain-containing protein [Pluralibacter gergoviae]MCK1067535.1 helix-turn-helix domain-containing protein [Pluralibacter gergoviae]MCV7760130.1 helix-turn-helix domain-containing protein [Pluralibacter gergoviae]PHH46364.1 hypothetical protein CRX51_11655 [Pluralibacter gergoviae]HDS1238846.1 helix-turn-helix domain-containing protein [Pluralibacter gergoviae]HDS1240378.1 helix-turn-helix domain-containing protein [Pluralibacter gergoviae]
MEIKLHANATTTPRVRRYLQESDKSDRELARELGISVTTVRRWRKRQQVSDLHTTPKVIHKAVIPEQAALINALRDSLRAPLDELLFMVNEGLGIAVSRATLNRYLRPVTGARAAQGCRALKGGARADTLTLRYRRLAMTMDDGGDHHLLWAREPVSGWCHARVYAGISPALVDRWLEETLSRCPAEIRALEVEEGRWLTAEREGFRLDKVAAPKQVTLTLDRPLGALVPAAGTADALAQRLCELWNSGRAQKKLGEKTPQAFLQALRQES